MSEICCDLCKYWLPELEECGNTHIDVCMNKEHFIKIERNCGTCEREIYNEALEDLKSKIDDEYYDGGYGDYHEVEMIVRILETMKR